MKFFYQDFANKSGIYKITNTHTNRIYIGQASRFKERWKGHKISLLSSKHQNKFLLNDFKKCKEELGHDDFLEFHVLEVMENNSKEERNQREEHWIEKYHDEQNKCYNMDKKPCGSNSMCDETKKKISISKRKINEIQNFYGIIVSPIGIEYEVWNLKKFAREHELDYRPLNCLFKGIRKVYKGWFLPKNKTYVEDRKQSFGKLISPNKEIYEVFHLTNFATEHGLNFKLLSQVFRETRKTHKGWKLYKEE